ncbi:cytokine receptor family member B16 isoform X2 [Scophthalmus maximus]|uniref:cytokine receptor family member B16 isoform X2 n=1 Tax=Scophthalmus maximus TaxID=52904 RepID=UPI001FA8B73A|nr:cytokine receptor family member B16 isoform X2 [Scophthalmus maximus]
MTPRRSVVLLLTTVTMLLHDVWMLRPPDPISMESVDMRHTLRWRPLQHACNTSVLYSVQFQGEFELTVLSGRWLNAPECQLIRHTHCDLTLDLGSDSDYNIRVRGQCGSQRSAWAELRPPFNRRDTVLTVPEMTVSVAGDALQVSFHKLPLTAVVRVTVWKKGDELQAVVYSMPAEQAVQHVPALQEGAVYCVRAQTILGTQLQSSSTDTQCVPITGPDAAWKSPTTVTVTVVVMAALLFAVFMSIVHWRPDVCQTYFRKEPIPNFLQPTGWDVQSPMSQQNLEVCERIVVVQSVDSDRRASNTDTPFPPHPEELGGELLLPLDCVESYHPQRPWDVPRYLSD